MPINRLVNASQAPRCQHIKVNGTRCGSPARHARDFCCFHDSAARRNREFVLPLVEDAASLQLALNRIMQALVDKLIDQKSASILLYGLQIAFANLKQLKGEQRADEFARALHAQHRAEEQDKPEAEPNLPQPGNQVPAGPNRQSSISNHQSSVAKSSAPPSTQSPHLPIAGRVDINACYDSVPQGRTLVAQDDSPGKHRSKRPESRRDGADALPTVDAVFAIDHRPSAALADHRPSTPPGFAIDHRPSTALADHRPGFAIDHRPSTIDFSWT